MSQTPIFPPAAARLAGKRDRQIAEAAWRKGIEAAAKVAEPGRKPCACIEMDDGGYWQQTCQCSNSGDLADAQAWCSEMNTAAAIRALQPPPDLGDAP
jgi:hypothetical protein